MLPVVGCVGGRPPLPLPLPLGVEGLLESPFIFVWTGELSVEEGRKQNVGFTVVLFECNLHLLVKEYQQQKSLLLSMIDSRRFSAVESLLFFCWTWRFFVTSVIDCEVSQEVGCDLQRPIQIFHLAPIVRVTCRPASTQWTDLEQTREWHS